MTAIQSMEKQCIHAEAKMLKTYKDVEKARTRYQEARIKYGVLKEALEVMKRAEKSK